MLSIFSVSVFYQFVPLTRVNNMKQIKIVFRQLWLAVTAVLFMLVTFQVQADCGDFPAPPPLLAQSVLNTAQLEILAPEMESYFIGVEAYQTCLDNEVTALVAPEPIGEDFENSPEFLAYQSEFDALMSIVEQLESQARQTTEQFNYHVVTAQPVEQE